MGWDELLRLGYFAVGWGDVFKVIVVFASNMDE
jgi:hypothetical protein